MIATHKFYLPFASYFCKYEETNIYSNYFSIFQLDR